MELLSNLTLGFGTALSPWNLVYCFVGCLLGTLIGVLPGLGPAATIAMLLPFTFSLDPSASLIMLSGIFYGAQYGGSTTAILVNIPGEASSVVTAIDGHQLAKQGHAGMALSTAALGSFFAGTVATLVIALFAPMLARAALEFGPAEYFSLMVLGLVASVALAHGSLLKALAMIVFGLLVGIVGIDVNSGASRMTFGSVELSDGVDIVAVAMGLFGLAEVMTNIGDTSLSRETVQSKISGLFPDMKLLRRIAGPVCRGTAIGSVLGILPGGGALLSSFASYAVEKKLSQDPRQFGRGAIEGVAGPESANNAGAQTSFIPMLTLGLPSNVTMALMIGAMIIQGIQPGPSVMTSQPTLFWGLIASMWVGNLMLVILNLPLIGIWIRLLTIPYKYLAPSIIVFCAIGVYTLNASSFNIFVMAAFGALGYILRKLECEPTPFLLGMILGPMMEEHMRRALMLSRGNPMTFVDRPISLILLLLAVTAIVLVTIPAVRNKRDEALVE
ncbi:tripartite tricarboxylate transporter permease [Microvirga zambiensis]|uniref:tripartite tricarboxylate transporter permease n=1 Tax=Microvirga zambiensis TaxID=1402137 RepID=UPI00191F72BF|nr:tripartite tricarboxylate transporter permease [Microvirga zambiensis]